MNSGGLQELISIFEQEHSRYAADAQRSDYLFILGTILLSVGGACFVGHLLTYFEDPEPIAFASPVGQGNAITQSVVTALLRRSHKLRAEARQFITLMFLLAIGGVTLFYFAGEYSYEKRASQNGLLNVFSRWQQEKNSSQKAIQDLFDKAVKEAAFTDNDGQKSALLQAATADATAIVELAKVESNAREVDIAVNRNILISSIVARAGLVALLGYLIRILLSSYRYNLRLATFNSSRAHSIAMLPDERLPKTLQELATVLGPEALDFEKLSETSVEDLAKVAIRSARS